jgi:hypothetical protein
MASHKTITLRLPPDDARLAELMARADEISVNEMFRRSLTHYCGLKKADPEFVARCREMLARDAEIVDKL